MFDFSFVLPVLLAKKIKFSWVCVDYRLYSVTIHRPGGGRIYLKCSFRLLPFSLQRLGEIFQTKPKMVFPYSSLSVRAWQKNKDIYIQDGSSFKKFKLQEALAIYARRDCLLLYKVMHSFFRIITPLLKGRFSVEKINSMGGLAINIFNKNFNSQNKVTLAMPKSEVRNLKLGYRGGRCEIFSNPEEGKNIRHFDFEGMYQRCIAGNFPTGRLSFTENVNDLDRPGFYYIEISCTAYMPVLPLKQDKLLFPQGQFSGLYWYEEIHLALEHTDVSSLKIKYAWLVNEYKPVLADFAKAVQAIKTTAAAKKITKQLVNSLYGRLGMDADYLRTDIVKAAKDLSEFTKYGGVYLRNTRVAPTRPKSNVALASIITARARIKLYKAMLAVLSIRGSRILYVDTDSIIAEFSKNNTPDNKNIGGGVTFDTTKSDTCINDAVFIAPKTYALRLKNRDEIIKVKGANQQNIYFDDLKEAFYAQKPIYLEKTSLRREGFTFINTTEQIKILTNSYNKRI